VESSCERGNEPSSSIKCGKFTEWLINWWSVEELKANQNSGI
jgi:hypothetical protein